MGKKYKVIKAVTNNIIRAKDDNNKEVIITGSGVGFNRSKNDVVLSTDVENLFVLENNQEQKNYSDLIMKTAPKIIDFSNELICYIQSKIDKPLDEHIHITLTDHIAFLVRRYKMGIHIENSNFYEMAIFYPKETEVAKEIVRRINNELDLDIPISEAAFICLHIVSAVSNSNINTTKKLTELLKVLTKLIEDKIMGKIDVNSLNYARLISHLKFLIARIDRQERFELPSEISKTIQNNYPHCYNLAFKMVRVIENELKTKIDDTEIAYLALHLYRFGAEY
ncbi:PRD domain-containing protein [Liquorilactobacillus sp.]|uniref:PRD domain-containing protein n=1 Tax=Liquorilactobacillus sp. TaxID=2767923 RepID=UPI0039E93E93